MGTGIGKEHRLPLNREKSELKYSPQALNGHCKPAPQVEWVTGLYFRTALLTKMMMMWKQSKEI